MVFVAWLVGVYWWSFFHRVVHWCCGSPQVWQFCGPHGWVGVGVFSGVVVARHHGPFSRARAGVRVVGSTAIQVSAMAMVWYGRFARPDVWRNVVMLFVGQSGRRVFIAAAIRAVSVGVIVWFSIPNCLVVGWWLVLCGGPVSRLLAYGEFGFGGDHGGFPSSSLPLPFLFPSGVGHTPLL